MAEFLLGFDIGSSSIKATLLNSSTGDVVGTAISPKEEMEISSPHPGWAEQDPDEWWEHIKKAINELLATTRVDPSFIAGIGISYQMHGLVLIDKKGKVLRPSIIWCDSRAVGIGEDAFKTIGEEKALKHLLNSPGNFTASKLKWVKDNEPDIYQKIDKILLPGDYIALKMTGESATTFSGLSEGIFWDYIKKDVASMVFQVYGIDESLLPPVIPTFSEQGRLRHGAASELGLKAGTPVGYRAGDQPNNAFSLNVLNNGEIAATAGTSGVIYGITNRPLYDPESRVNTFIHVNHTSDSPSYGVLLCINGTGIMNSWLKHHTGIQDYPEMNAMASGIPVGSDGIRVFPFGNGAERVLVNRNPGAMIAGLDLNRHHRGHLLRAAQEGIVFSLNYGFEIMKSMGMMMNMVRAGEANMFLSPVFREAFVNTTETVVELYNTDGAQGAARAAGVGIGHYSDFKEAFSGLKMITRIEPDPEKMKKYRHEYNQWLHILNEKIL